MSMLISGFRAWMVQRITALLLVLGSLLLLSLLISPPADGFDAWKTWIQQPLPIIAILLFSLALGLHAWVGIRDVIMDYLHSVTLRVFALTLLAVYLLGSYFWLLWILVK